jgi:hypothetical protein
MLTINLSRELENELSSLTNDKETFIIEAIREKIALNKNAVSREESMKEESNIFEHKIVIEEFNSTRIENWGDY